jgi:hypothetical protein
MDRKELADEIRGAGYALRFADGPVVGIRTLKGKRMHLESPEHKILTCDAEIIRIAATCSTCDAVASKFDIQFAADIADCYRSFARLIWPCIDHDDYCKAEPYLPVSEDARTDFAKMKADFMRRRKQMQQKLVAEKAKKSAKKLRASTKTTKKKASKKQPRPTKKKQAKRKRS